MPEPGEKFERLKERIIPTGRRYMYKSLSTGVPEDLIRRELHEDLGEDRERRGLNGCIFPRRQGRGEVDIARLQHLKGKCRDGVVSLDATTISVHDLHSVLAVRDDPHDRIEE